METNRNESIIDGGEMDNGKCLKAFRQELLNILNNCNSQPETRFCVAIEEGEAWFLGDIPAVKATLSSDLQPKIESHRTVYISAAAKVAEVLEGSSGVSDGHVLLAPMESNVIPLPHQIHALSCAISGDQVRYLLADEVGLGKTIEAGQLHRFFDNVVFVNI